MTKWTTRTPLEWGRTQVPRKGKQFLLLKFRWKFMKEEILVVLSCHIRGHLCHRNTETFNQFMMVILHNRADKSRISAHCLYFLVQPFHTLTFTYKLTKRTDRDGWGSCLCSVFRPFFIFLFLLYWLLYSLLWLTTFDESFGICRLVF